MAFSQGSIGSYQRLSSLRRVMGDHPQRYLCAINSGMVRQTYTRVQLSWAGPLQAGQATHDPMRYGNCHCFCIG